MKRSNQSKHYVLGEEPKHAGRKLLTVVRWGIPAALVAAGLYLGLLALAPRLATTPRAPLVGVKKVSTTVQASDKNDYIIIPKINLKTPIVTGTNEAALLKGAWHRYPWQGDPVKGGNFVLAAHRFLMGWTPQQTRAKSPFYNIDKLAVGDQIIIIFKQKTYTYHVTKMYTVQPQDIGIENPTRDARLTLYSCTLKGSADGRSVIQASL